MKTRNKTLFGGALLVAGIVASGAHADNPADDIGFQFAYGLNNYVGAGWISGTGFVSLEDAASGPGAVGPVSYNFASYSGNVQDAYASVGTHGMWVNAYNYNTYGYGFASFAYGDIYLQHNYDQKLNISWDWGAEINGDVGYIYIDGPNGVATYDLSAYAYGQLSLNVAAGSFVFIRGNVVAGFVDGADSAFFHVDAKKVPAPGALALLGAAGLATMRRRRR